MSDAASPIPVTSTSHRVSNQDIIIAVMGATGVGKSSFINVATGDDHATIGHNLLSCTKAVQAVSCRHPRSDFNIVFLDTPGFDDTHLTDADVLTEIADWLTTTYKRGITLTGLLFLHRISDNRMAGTSLRNTHMFENLCGTDAFQNVMLTTTMWSEVSQQAGTEREEELRTNFWKPMITAGSRIVRFGDTYQSAWEILDQVIGTRRPLQLQVEMVDEGKPLMLTTAGSALMRWLDDLVAQFRAIIVALQVRLRAIPKDSNPEIAEGVLCEKLATQHNLEQARQQRVVISQPAKQPRRAFVEVVKHVTTSRTFQPTSLPNADSHPSMKLVPSRASSPKAPHNPQTSIIDRRGIKTAVATAVVIRARDAAIAPVPFLKGIMSLTWTVLESIEAMDRADLSLRTLAKNARRFIIAIEEQMQIGGIPGGVRHAVENLTKELCEVQAVLDKMSTRGQLHRYILQAVDKHVFSTCNESIRTALEIFEMRCNINAQQILARIEARLDGNSAQPMASRIAPLSRSTL